ncbi:MAG: ThuA domain-containing protein [Acidimicrobiales bacterium]
MTAERTPLVHLVVGGYPPGSSAGHDMDYARRRLLDLLGERPVHTTVANDYADLDRWLGEADLLLTYAAGPYPAGPQLAALDAWLERGGRWLALHGTSGGKAERVPGERRARRMVKMAHHRTLGGFFLNHPPVRRFEVAVAAEHALTAGVPARFEVDDELYLVELGDDVEVLLTTELAADPSPPGFGFVYDSDTALLPDGRTRALGHVRHAGAGAVAYLALGHCHNPTCNTQPFVDASVEPDGRTPLEFRGSWETAGFLALLRNGIAWGTAPR